MKKLLPALFVGCALWSGCSTKNMGERPRIGVAMPKFDDSQMSRLRHAIEAAATEKAVLSIADGQNQQPTQNDQVDSLLALKVKALAINLVEREAAGAILEKAKEKKVPVVFFDREPSSDDMTKSDKVFYVGSNAGQSGTMQGEILAAVWKADPAIDRNADGKLRLVLLNGASGDREAALRMEGSVKAIADAGILLEKLAEESVHVNRAEGREKMAALLAKHGDRIEAVLCGNDEVALGAIEALKAKGYFDGRKSLPVLGIGAGPEALDAIMAGELLGTVSLDADSQGKAVFDLAYCLARGADSETAGWAVTDGKYVWIPARKVTRENYLTFMK